MGRNYREGSCEVSKREFFERKGRGVFYGRGEGLLSRVERLVVIYSEFS